MTIPWKAHDVSEFDLKRNLTNLLNKISSGNQESLIADTCNYIHVEDHKDATLIMESLYHRAIHDGQDGCYYGIYAKFLKALHQGYADSFQAIQLPLSWDALSCLVDSFMVQEAKHFKRFVDERQRWRLVTASILKFLAHLSLAGLWNIKTFIHDLFWLPKLRSALQTSCTKGWLLDHLIAGYRTVDLEATVDCMCTLLQVVGGHGFYDVEDKLVPYLDDLLGRATRGEDLFGTRIRVLIQGLLEQRWARNSSILTRDISQVNEETEMRIDPRDGKTYALREFLEYYGKLYTEREIKLYFAFECIPCSRIRAQSVASRYKRPRRRIKS